MSNIQRMNLKRMFILGLSITLLYVLAGRNAFASTYDIPSDGNVIGEYHSVSAKSGETLLDIAERNSIGMYEIIRANPQLNNKRLSSGTKVIIPSQFHLPSGPRVGIVLNLADMRIFYYHPDGDRVSTYPVGVGRQGWSTPQGKTAITTKEPHPDWVPPPSIRTEAARKGKILPARVAPGPKNPLGQYALHLGFKGILIHGTNAPSSIGLRSSHGCIRLFAADIEKLFSMTHVGTPVRILRESH